MGMTRKQAIEELQKMLDYCSIRQDSTPERKQALVYAISSLKTDEAYQIMYEGREIFTKADMVAMLTELQMDIEECVDGGEGAPLFEQGVDAVRCQVVDMIQQKINALKGGKE